MLKSLPFTVFLSLFCSRDLYTDRFLRGDFTFATVPGFEAAPATYFEPARVKPKLWVPFRPLLPAVCLMPHLDSLSRNEFLTTFHDFSSDLTSL